MHKFKVQTQKNTKKERLIKMKMEWRNCYLDIILIPLSLIIPVCYHGWLMYIVRTQHRSTVIGINSAARRLWVISMMKDNEKKNILAVQTIRNMIMGSTLMATTSILLCSALAAIISSTYSVKQPINNSVLGAHGEVVVAIKYVLLLLIFLFAFLFYSLSIGFINQFNFLVNTPYDGSRGGHDEEDLGSILTVDYVYGLLERACILNNVGNRIFYSGLPVLLWIFGPVLVFVCSVVMIPILYNLDFVGGDDRKSGRIGKLEDDGTEYSYA